MVNRIGSYFGRALATYLEKSTGSYVAFSVIPPGRLRRTLRPGDVLLIEGNSRISSAIKYLTNSTWSHAALYVGGPPETALIEADLKAGVRAVPVLAYDHLNTRICRPVGLRPDDLATVIAFMRASVGKTYDLKNVLDLARYLLPQPPVPKRWRRRMLALGSGDPTRAICSTLIAEAFDRVRYPILPEVRTEIRAETLTETGGALQRELLHIRHHSLYTPRDFDLSPYFRIVKPTVEAGFDYRNLQWYEDPATEPEAAPHH